MKANNVLLPVFLGVALVLGIAIGSYFNFPVKPVSLVESGQREEKLRQIMDFIDYEYVDQVNTDSLLNLTIEGLLKRLDPHSSYIPPELVTRSDESMMGSFEGIGIEFKIYRDTLTVVHTIEEGPSAKAGIVQGDRILAADEKPLFGSKLKASEVIKALKGEAGTLVALNVFRPDNKISRLVQVKREAVPLNSLQTYFMLDHRTGYLKLLRFSQTSSTEVRRAIAELKKEGAEQLILDLRDNPGGLLKAAREVADEFLDENQMIVYTRDREGRIEPYKATNKGTFQRGELAILINETSASASEIVAGALQDNDRAWIVGRRSFGKGLVQEEITLNDGSRLRLTTQKYFTPSGRSIQKPYGDYGQGQADVLPVTDSMGIDGAEQFQTSGGRRVYSGGGVRPDFEVGSDTSNATAFIYHLGLIADFDEKAFTYIDENRKELASWTEGQFIDNFEVDQVLMDYFFGRHLNTVLGQSSATVAMVKDRIKAYIAYNLFGSAAFQKVYVTRDLFVREAQRVLADSSGMVP